MLRRVGYRRASLIFANKDAALGMLDAVCESMCEYMRLVREAGCDAVFFSVNSAICPPHSRGVSEDVARTFLRPFEVRMLEAMAGMVRVLHIHGTSLDVRRVLDYPVEAVGVSDRLPGNPSLGEMRALTDKCLMGGVNEWPSPTLAAGDTAKRCSIAFARLGARILFCRPGAHSDADSVVSAQGDPETCENCRARGRPRAR